MDAAPIRTHIQQMPTGAQLQRIGDLVAQLIRIGTATQIRRRAVRKSIGRNRYLRRQPARPNRWLLRQRRARRLILQVMRDLSAHFVLPARGEHMLPLTRRNIHMHQAVAQAAHPACHHRIRRLPQRRASRCIQTVRTVAERHAVARGQHRIGTHIAKQTERAARGCSRQAVEIVERSVGLQRSHAAIAQQRKLCWRQRVEARQRRRGDDVVIAKLHLHRSKDTGSLTPRPISRQRQPCRTANIKDAAARLHRRAAHHAIAVVRRNRVGIGCRPRALAKQRENIKVWLRGRLARKYLHPSTRAAALRGEVIRQHTKAPHRALAIAAVQGWAVTRRAPRPTTIRLLRREPIHGLHIVHRRQPAEAHPRRRRARITHRARSRCVLLLEFISPHHEIRIRLRVQLSHTLPLVRLDGQQR